MSNSARQIQISKLTGWPKYLCLYRDLRAETGDFEVDWTYLKGTRTSAGAGLPDKLA